MTATADRVLTTSASARDSAIADFLANLDETVNRVMRGRVDADFMESNRGLPPFVLRDIMAAKPLSAFIPDQYGGFGDSPVAIQGMLDVMSYQSMSLGLMMGINGALFIQPVAKYADEQVGRRVLKRMAAGHAMGGLMITEPDFGTDALSMQTAWRQDGQSYTIQGTKHWAGLTGWADYWLVMARPMNEDGGLSQGVDLFICEQDHADQRIEVISRYPNLGLYGLPYGRNKVDVRVPLDHRLDGGRGGLRMMLDMLHHSRMQFPGMAIGFLRRIADEAVRHTRERTVSGSPLIGYDQVQARVARIQGRLALVSALSLYAAEHAAADVDLSRAAVASNAAKTVCSDYMHDAAQSLLQLVGARGYATDHIAGRSVVDARPFQIFEGSNDVLYAQIGAKTTDQMRKRGTSDLGAQLRADYPEGVDLAKLGAELDVSLPDRPSQRRIVDVGFIVSRLHALGALAELATRGFPPDHVAAGAATAGEEIRGRLTALRDDLALRPAEAQLGVASWMPYLKPGV
ncbi:acyl-CoA dehydrogenase family protein [Cumulibacter manganitolerans]|uniref:acyl-CoA dehydrogenase family protein n=1 Tax=Cumulibacter manganitolerans TaxID=1884992 RepID=UPI001886356C|nr:acyl-CoA dehydrogenase [Cumulibacter manganitolerans]